MNPQTRPRRRERASRETAGVGSYVAPLRRTGARETLGRHSSVRAGGMPRGFGGAALRAALVTERNPGIFGHPGERFGLWRP